MDKFKIGGQYYNVQRITDLAITEGKGGEILFYKKVIRLQDGMEPQQENDIIIHELVHGMLNMMGEHEKNNDEESVDRITEGILMLLVDNRAFFMNLLNDC